MARTAREPTFLPLTISTAATVTDERHGDPGVRRVHHCALRLNSAAADCWAALLAGCDAPGRRDLPGRLRELTGATSAYAGAMWWNGEGSSHRGRIARAQDRIVEAVAERDGPDFVEAFVGYDQAIATALVRVHVGSRSRSTAR